MWLDRGDRQYSDETYWETDFSVEIDPETYQGSIHDSLPVILKDRLDDDEVFRAYFEIEEPNRVWVEGESSSYWDGAEDFVHRQQWWRRVDHGPGRLL